MESGTGDLHVVIGGSGGVGSAVVRLLAGQGKSVRAVNRSGKMEAPDGVELVGADARKAEKMILACRGATVVYHCAHPKDDYGEFLPITANIISGTEAAEAKLVMAASAYSYGKVEGPMTEDLPDNPVGLSGGYHTRGADMVKEAHQDGRIRGVIGRASNYFGPNAPVMWPGINFQDALAGNKASVIGDVDMVHTYTYVDDFANGLITLAEHDSALGEVWHVPSAENITTRQFLEKVYQAAGTELNIQSASRFILGLLGLFNPTMRKAQDVYYQFDRPFILDYAKYKEAFGADPTPHDEAIDNTLAYFRQNS